MLFEGREDRSVISTIGRRTLEKYILEKQENNAAGIKVHWQTLFKF